MGFASRDSLKNCLALSSVALLHITGPDVCEHFISIVRQESDTGLERLDRHIKLSLSHINIAEFIMNLCIAAVQAQRLLVPLYGRLGVLSEHEKAGHGD